MGRSMWPDGVVGGMRGALRAFKRLLILLGWFVVELLLLVLLCVTGALMSIGLGFLAVPTSVDMLRRVADVKRRYAREWSGLIVEPEYRPLTTGPEGPGVFKRAWALLKDPGTWRDIRWLLMDTLIGVLIITIAPGITGYGLWGVLSPITWHEFLHLWDGNWYLFILMRGGDEMIAIVILGIALVIIGLRMAPPTLRLYNRFVAWALSPSEVARLERRVHRLAEDRRDTVDSSAEQLHRIERDLHDGAQARLVAMGMTISAAQTMLRSDLGAAEALLADAKNCSAQALDELRNLVRGVHPPVLADRGLADAVRALAADCPMPAKASIGVFGRFAPAIESVAYFSVSELLTNAVKHSQASRVSIELQVEDGSLIASVMDDGIGGAVATGGSGLRGLQRRLSPLDGELVIDSPVGGPSVMRVVIPLGTEDRERS